MSSPGAPQQGFPRLDAPFVDPLGNIQIPWYRLLIQLFKLSGGSNIPLDQGIYLVLEGGFIDAYSTQDDSFIARLAEANVPGGAPIPISLTISPQSYSAATDGTLVVSSGKLELSRDSGVSWKQVSLVGGALPMLVHDVARMTWFGTAPIATFFPI